MKYRKLRIAWSVGWGMVVAFVIVMWVRSYWRCDLIRGLAVPRCCDIYSDRGFFAFCWFNNQVTREFMVDEWTYHEECSGFFEDIVAGPLDFLGVGLYRGNPERYVFLSHWAAMLLIGTAAAAPWLPYRFSLRTLLIATTLVAVGLGMVVWLAR